MSERNEQQPENDVLDRASADLRAARIPDGPPAHLLTSTLQALQAVTSAPDTIRFQERKRPMFRIVRYRAAAVMLAVFAGSFWLIDRNASFGFAQVVDKVKNAKSVSFVLRQKIGLQPEFESKMLIKNDIIRYDLAGATIMILDTSQRKGMQLDVARKIATKIDMEGRVPAEDLQDPIEQLRKLNDNIKDNVTPLGDEELDGRKCQVFQVRGRPKKASMFIPDQFKLWVDARTKLPVKIHAEDKNVSLTFEQFRWDEALKQELFSLKVPPGYLLEELTPAVVRPGRIYYQQAGIELRSIQPDGKKPEVQFVPRPDNSPRTYCSDRSELSPDGRYLAIAYTNVTKEGAFPPDRVLLWDRTRPKDEAAEVYVRPEGELQSWQFSADGRRLYVSFWEGVAGRKDSVGRYGTEVVDLKAKTKQPLKLPRYKNAEGKEEDMRFAAASADGGTYLVVGQGLHVATADGKLVRRLSPPDAIVIVDSVRLAPDGKQAIYVTFQPDRPRQLFVVPLNGAAPKALLAAGKLTELRARWSPDGKRIAYTGRLFDPANSPFHRGKESYLRLIDCDGTNAVTLVTEKVHPNGPGLDLTAWR